MNKLLLVLACSVAAHAADIVMFGSSTLANGVTVRYTTKLDPPLRDSQTLMLEGGHLVIENRIHRSLREKNTGASYGYDLLVEPEGPRRFRVRIEPLTGQPGGALVAPPKYPPPQVIEQGDIIALDLLVSPDGRRKLVDYIEVSHTADRGPDPAIAARDFTLDDGAVALRFSVPTRVYINGQMIQDGILSTMKPGATMWFAVPGRGRYILSLSPHEGFKKGGAIQDRSLTFRAGADFYEIRSGAPLLGAGKAWNLYVHHDPIFESDMKVHPPMHFGVDRMENLLNRGMR